MQTKQQLGGIARAKKLNSEQRKEIAKAGAIARWGLKAKHKGSFLKDFGIDVDCYVLDDDKGTAVLTQSGLAKLLGYENQRAGWSLSRLLQRKSMASSLGTKACGNIKNPIKFQYISHGTKTPPFNAFGYDATLIIDICNAVLGSAQKDDGIPRQIVANSGIILGACAKTGIRELIYKLAGYNSTQAQVIAAFRTYVQEEARKWAKEFPDEIYAEWQRIYEIHIPEHGRNWSHKWLTLKYIYYPLAKSNGRLLNLLREAKGEQKSKKLHQFLSEVGVDALRAQIWQTVGVAKASSSKEKYESAMCNLIGGQIPLEFEGD